SFHSLIGGSGNRTFTGFGAYDRARTILQPNVINLREFCSRTFTVPRIPFERYTREANSLSMVSVGVCFRWRDIPIEKDTERGYSNFMPKLIVTCSPDVLGGTPVFAGTRVPVQTLIE